MLIGAGADVNKPSNYLDRPTEPIAIAASRGVEHAAKLLEEAGARTRMKAAIGWTLHAACFAGQKDVVRLLIKTGANVSERDERGKTPMPDSFLIRSAFKTSAKAE
jgi:ankyrin repeat protein